MVPTSLRLYAHDIETLDIVYFFLFKDEFLLRRAIWKIIPKTRKKLAVIFISTFSRQRYADHFRGTVVLHWM